MVKLYQYINSDNSAGLAPVYKPTKVTNLKEVTRERKWQRKIVLPGMPDKSERIGKQTLLGSQCK